MSKYISFCEYSNPVYKSICIDSNIEASDWEYLDDRDGLVEDNIEFKLIIRAKSEGLNEAYISSDILIISDENKANINFPPFFDGAIICDFSLKNDAYGINHDLSEDDCILPEIFDLENDSLEV